MTCKFPECSRKALKGWTTCARHRTAGMNLAHWKRAQKQKQKK